MGSTRANVWRMAGVSASLALAATTCGRVGFEQSEIETSWTFVDDEVSEFELGDYGAGTAQLGWDGEQVKFAGEPPYALATEGVFVSALFDTGAPDALWETLAWTPSSPDGRPLPNESGTDTGYASRSVSMTDNILLLHLEDLGANQGDKVVDTSGQGHHGTIELDGQSVNSVEGRFGSAMDVDRDAWVRLEGTYFDFGTSDFTYAIWVKMRGCAASNDNRIAMGGGGAGDSPHMWMGILCPVTCPDGDDAYMNFLDDSRTGAALKTCSGVVLDDGNWHHLAGVKRGHTSPPALLQLFVDGREVNTATHDYGANTFTYTGGELRLGGFNLGGTKYNTSIIVDEAAIWKRALSDAEVASLYHRGAASLELQIRVCSETGCGSEAFVGPDGTSATFFSEADLAGPPGSQRGNIAALGLVGAKAQYRARFETSASAASPGLRMVRLEARKP